MTANNGTEWLAERFEADRAKLRAVAYRMLGSAPEADDAVQEAWLRVSQSGTEGVRNLTAWMTTVVARLCLDMLRSRRARASREEGFNTGRPELRLVAAGAGTEPEPELLLAESIGPALLVVLDSLAPAERLAFVLHDMFGVPFDEIGPMVGRSPMAARQLASRARRRARGAAGADDVQAGASEVTVGGPPEREREIVSAFLAASRGGDLDALIALLDPDVVLFADTTAVEGARTNQARGAPALASEVRGVSAVADVFSGRARAVRLALVDGGYGAAFAMGGKPWAVFGFSIVGDKVVEIEIISDPATIAGMEVTIVPAASGT